MEHQPKTGMRCACKRGVQRANCPHCEGTGWQIDFRAIHARRSSIVRVIRDPSNYERDYHLPRAEADALYRRGFLAYDMTNQCYAEREPRTAAGSLD